MSDGIGWIGRIKWEGRNEEMEYQDEERERIVSYFSCDGLSIQTITLHVFFSETTTDLVSYQPVSLFPSPLPSLEYGKREEKVETMGKVRGMK